MVVLINDPAAIAAAAFLFENEYTGHSLENKLLEQLKIADDAKVAPKIIVNSKLAHEVRCTPDTSLLDDSFGFNSNTFIKYGDVIIYDFAENFGKLNDTTARTLFIQVGYADGDIRYLLVDIAKLLRMPASEFKPNGFLQYKRKENIKNIILWSFTISKDDKNILPVDVVTLNMRKNV